MTVRIKIIPIKVKSILLVISLPVIKRHNEWKIPNIIEYIIMTISPPDFLQKL
ncbi:hypothetical protein [Tenacibaculum maritimum]|uniref:hypothetical protein n=1 Tax=Tenacibaculum maritimum TaxID=107401 RepID=UPI00132FAE73|nr:hypothetical protein [Tenacibaculum maritimum]MCD9610661.1 hypothetical protein [Tenacibaculum maritimum]